jgi:phosphatidate cytidylyltransferase
MPDPQPSDTKNSKPGRGAVFLRRATSTIVLWALIAGAIAFESAYLFSGLIVAVGVLAGLEFLGLLGLRGSRGWSAVRGVSIAVGGAYLIGAAVLCYQSGAGALGLLDPAGVAAIVILTTVALLFHPIDGQKTKDMFFGSVFGFVYTALLASFLLRLLFFGGGGGELTGHYYILFLLVVTKFADMGAYIVGTAIGKNKFIPHISPGKTWEGILLGCFPFAVGGGATVFALFGARMPLLNWGHVVALGFVLAAVAVVGDLAESVLKRCLAKKDSGAVLPGIGGVLDLVDSILFTAPVMYFYLIAIS